MEFLKKGPWGFTTVCSVGKYVLIIYFFGLEKQVRPLWAVKNRMKYEYEQYRAIVIGSLACC